MLPLEVLIPFIGAAFALSISPGPDNIFVLTQSALYGRKAGVLVTLGLCAGLLFHTALVAFGVAVLFQTHAVAFIALKFVGALYLLYLAWGAFLAVRNTQTLDAVEALSSIQLFKRGVVMNVTNPKVSIFFLAFLPQFAKPEIGPLMPQLFSLGLVFMGVAFSTFTAIAVFASVIGEFFRRSVLLQKLLNGIACTVFVLLALNLLLFSAL